MARKLKKVFGAPACVLGNRLVIADLHVGIEKELAKEGIRVRVDPSPMLEEILRLLNLTRARELLVLGDLKHDVYGASWQERKALQEFVENIPVPVTLFKGNHDGGIEEWLDIPVVQPQGKRVLGYWLLHGHARPPEEEKGPFLAAHSHPALSFQDPFGGVSVEKVWVEQEDLIIMPAFNPLIGGSDVRKGIAGPMKKYYDPKKARLFLLDGLEVSV